MDIIEKITELLEEKFKMDEKFTDCFTVEVELKPVQRLNVFIDSDTGIDFVKCQKISRYLESHIDAHNWLGERYTIEVSSPGLSRSLKFARQYPRNIGRTLEVTTLDGHRKKATLKTADDLQIVLTEEVVTKVGKKKIKTQVDTPITYDTIEKAFVKASFKPSGVANDLDDAEEDSE